MPWQAKNFGRVSSSLPFLWGGIILREQWTVRVGSRIYVRPALYIYVLIIYILVCIRMYEVYRVVGVYTWAYTSPQSLTIARRVAREEFSFPNNRYVCRGRRFRGSRAIASKRSTNFAIDKLTER